MSWLLRLAVRVCAAASSAALLLLLAAPCWAVSSTQFDNFDGGALQGWGVSNGLTPVGSIAENGPSANTPGVGALAMDTLMYGSGKLLVNNSTTWTGNWTDAAIGKIAVDVRNPNVFELFMHIGIAGPGGAGSLGDVHVTPGIAVAADNLWHVLTFDVLTANFTSVTGTSTAAALANVTQMRILHNASEGVFTGGAGGRFFLDNIRVVAAAVPGDYNQNGTVDAADYVLWRDQSGQSGAGLTADGTGPGGTPDGTVNSLDYDFWKARFGNTSGAGSAVGAGGSELNLSPVPEPATWVLLLALPLIAWRPVRSKR